MKPLLLTTKAEVIQQIDRCRDRIHACEDVIKQCSGIPSENLQFTLSVSGAPVYVLDFLEDETEFSMSYFMSWLTFYRRRLQQLNDVLGKWQ